MLPHFSFKFCSRVPVEGRFVRPNLFNCDSLLKSIKGKYAAGIIAGLRFPFGAIEENLLSNWVPIIFVALEISMISIYAH